MSDNRTTPDPARKISRDQAEKVYGQLFPMVNYLLRLKGRMEKRGFHHEDPYYLATVKAYNSAVELANKIHELTLKQPNT